jgi:tetratricopeptide (TPR) repeat protein
MALSEIEKLERRYAENPQGLTFAPLAEVHRKNGDVARALELLRPGLTLHPDYIPASIVLGRCHLDLGELPAAEAAFTHVLSLDGENVIALKALADIMERQFRFDEAERWLGTLLTVDRTNDEARDQLGRVETARRQAETASSASPDAAAASTAEAVEAPPAEPPAPAAPAMSHPPLPEPPAEATLAWAEESGPTAADDVGALDLEELDLDAGEGASPPEGIELEQPVTLEEPVEPLSGLVGRDNRESGAKAPEVSDGWQVETAEDIVLRSAGGSEFQVANAAEELLSRAGRSLREPDPLMPERPAVERREASGEPPPSVSEPVAEAAEEEPVGATGPSSAEPAAPAAAEAHATELPRHPEPDLVVTESMASLLLEQGHRAEALVVYRHLEQRTADTRFQEKIADLEREAASPAPAPVAERAAAVRAATAAAAPSYSVHETKGQSVQSFLRGVLGGRLSAASGGGAAHAEPPRPAPESTGSGAPTRPAHDSLSLSSVFGEESTPTPPAVPAGGSSGGAPSGVSYDEFFGSPGSGPARSPRAPDAKSDDLDQFHAWLQNLKR